MFWLGVVVLGQKSVGAHTEAKTAADAARAIAVEIGAPTALAYSAWMINYYIDDDDEALVLIDEALALAQNTGGGLTESYMHTARAVRVARQGDPVTARATLVSLASDQHRAGRFLDAWNTVKYLIDVFTRLGLHAAAATLIGATRVSPITEVSALDLDQLSIPARAQLDSASFERLTAGGGLMSLDDAIRFAKSESASNHPARTSGTQTSY